MTTANLQQRIQQDPKATSRVLRYLDQLGIEHSGQISGSTLAQVCGNDSRSWRQWTGGERAMPAQARRLLCAVAGVELPWIALPVEGRTPKSLQHIDGDQVLVRLRSGAERQAWWRPQMGGVAGGYYDSEDGPGEPIDGIVAVLPLETPPRRAPWRKQTQRSKRRAVC